MKKTILQNLTLALLIVVVSSVAISQGSEGVRPIADAGSSRYAAQDPVVLDSTGSYDRDNSSILSYTWRQIGGPSLVISDANTANPTISGFIQTDEIQECEFELVVSDGDLTSLPDTVKVIIVPDFGVNKLIHLNPPFDPDKPTLAAFGGAGGCQNIKDGTYLTKYEEWRAIANFISFGNFHASIYKDLGDMFIVYLSSQAPDYKQAIQTFGHSAGGEPAIDVAIYLNETYADRRYAVNHVTLIDSAGYCRDYKASIARFLASAVDGEQCWINNYSSTLPGAYGMKMDFGFQANVLNVWFDRTTDNSFTAQQNHQLSHKWYRESLTCSDMNEFNNGVVAGAYWSVIGPGKNLQLASTPDVETYKFTWYGDEFSGYMDFYDEPNHPGKLPEPVTLLAYSDALDPNGVVLTCKESENAVGYQLLFGSDPYRVMDYNIISDTPTPPNEIITALPFEETWWTVRIRDQYGSTIYADPMRINTLILFLPIENITAERRYGYIQDAIDDAATGDEIVVKEGVYRENIDFKGKNLMVRSIDPNDPDIVANTIINGSHQGPVINLYGNQETGCELAGLTITGGTVGISCGDASPVIRNCTIESNRPIAIEYLSGYEPIIIDCTILGQIIIMSDEPGLIAHWRLDELEGDITADSAGQNDANVIGDLLWQPEGGMVNGAIELDGIGDYVKTDFVLNPAEGPFSVFAWIKGGAPGQAVLSQMGGARWLCADPSEGNLMTELKGTGRGANELLSQTNIADGNWHRIGLVWDGSHRTLYVDDVAVAEDTQANLEGSNNSLYIGTGTALEAGTYWSGLIDDVRIYNRAVSP